MKLSLVRETLLKPLQLVIGVVERKQTLPILSNVLLTTHQDQLSITGTDLEVELVGQTQLINHHMESCQITVPGRKLMDICRALPENSPIELHRDKEKIILRSGRSRFTLSTLPAEDFPNVEKQDSQISFSLPQGQLHRLLQRTYFAMAQQDVRYYLNGLLLEAYPGKLRAVATDGHRLATNSINISTDVEHRVQIIIPRKGVLELLRLLVASDDPATVTIGNNHIRVATHDFIFTSKLVDGRFPDYERVIPKNSDKFITIDRDLLKQALYRASILCNEKFKGVRFELRHGLLRISSNNPEQEAAEEEINIDYSQQDLDIGFNVSYLLDILNTLDAGIVKLAFLDANNSVLIEQYENNEDGIFVVMPMRL
jgi:DNA polymerase-3 subunit beta